MTYSWSHCTRIQASSRRTALRAGWALTFKRVLLFSYLVLRQAFRADNLSLDFVVAHSLGIYPAECIPFSYYGIVRSSVVL